MESEQGEYGLKGGKPVGTAKAKDKKVPRQLLIIERLK